MTANDTAASARPSAADLGRTIEQAKQQLEHMIDLNPQVMLLVDRRGRVVRANRALLSLLGIRSFQQVLKRPVGELFPCQDTQFLQQTIGQAAGYHVGESRVDLPGRKNRQIRFTVVSSGKDADLHALIVHDITAESERARRTEKEHKRQAVETLMGALMHDINQPLTVIMMRVQLMMLALQKGTVDVAEFGQSLQDVLRMTMQIAETLRHIREPRDYVTKPYLGDVDILDIERSGGPKSLFSYSRILLDAFMVALEAHFPGCEGHSRRTAACAELLARRMKLDTAEVDTVRRAAFFHDIGKIGVPDSILQKPQALTPEETAIMRRHSQIGYDLLHGFPFLESAAAAVYAHHEWFNGAGYPRGLKGKDIPLPARIVAVADVYDILRTGRDYQPATSRKEAEKVVLTASGTQFDPTVVDAFKACAAELDAFFSSSR